MSRNINNVHVSMDVEPPSHHKHHLDPTWKDLIQANIDTTHDDIEKSFKVVDGSVNTGPSISDDTNSRKYNNPPNALLTVSEILKYNTLGNLTAFAPRIRHQIELAMTIYQKRLSQLLQVDITTLQKEYRKILRPAIHVKYADGFVGYLQHLGLIEVTFDDTFDAKVKGYRRASKLGEYYCKLSMVEEKNKKTKSAVDGVAENGTTEVAVKDKDSSSDEEFENADGKRVKKMKESRELKKVKRFLEKSLHRSAATSPVKTTPL
ncbi:hypothetical protein HDU76_007708, partial [Blyttiomyces sp. JEL0837]